MKCLCKKEMDCFESAYDGRENKIGEYHWCPECGRLCFLDLSNKALVENCAWWQTPAQAKFETETG